MNQRVRSVLRFLAWLSTFGICSLALGFTGLFLYLDPQIPEANSYRNYSHETPLRIFSKDGSLLAEYGLRRLIPIAIEDVPPLYLEAVINTEDKRFYEHGGIDWISLANDMIELVFKPSIKRGASTITMQLPRNVADLSREQTVIRKAKEMLLAMKIERELTKDEILELYVNVVPFGKRAYGIQAASFTYYGKPIDELNIAQVAMLAGIPKRPEAGNPINGPEWALERRNLVLRRLRDADVITADEYRVAHAQPITAEVHRRELDLYSPYPSELVRQQLFDLFGSEIYTGFDAYTTIDIGQQAAAQLAVQSALIDYDRRYGYRGAERHIDDVAESTSDEERRERYVLELASESLVGDLVPAVVWRTYAQSIEVVLADGSTLEIAWDGLRWARRSLGSAGVARSPRVATEIVRNGDVVRVREVDEAWQLAQVPEVEGALVAIDPRSGAITAMSGGFNFSTNQFNHASQLQRQPGSGFKPFVYSAALSSGVTPSTVYMDAPLVFDDANLETAYRPRNDSGTYNGPTRLREALYRSINLVSIRVLADVGAEVVRNYVGRFGFDPTKLPKSTQLAMGGGSIEVSPLQMATAYSIFANGGYLIEAHLLDHVRTTDGTVVHRSNHPVVCDPCVDPVVISSPKEEVLETSEKQPAEQEELVIEAQRVVDERIAFIMNSMLRDVIREGTGRRAQALNRKDLAGKTGTTNEAVDTWFNGFHPTLAATAWVGFDDRKPLGDLEYGSTRPLTIWIDFMNAALEGVPEHEFMKPDGVVTVKIDPVTGMLARPDQSEAISEYFLEERSPANVDGLRSARTDGGLRPENIF